MRARATANKRVIMTFLGLSGNGADPASNIAVELRYHTPPPAATVLSATRDRGSLACIKA